MIDFILLRTRKNGCNGVISSFFLVFFLHSSAFCFTFALGNKCKTGYELDVKSIEKGN